MVDQRATFSLPARIFYTLLWDGYSPPALYHSVRYTMLLFSHSPAFLCIAFWPGSFAIDIVYFYISGLLCVLREYSVVLRILGRSHCHSAYRAHSYG